MWTLAGVRGSGGHPDADWVARGESLDANEAIKARNQWKAFVKVLPPYPGASASTSFTGRGIVMTGCVELPFRSPCTIVSFFLCSLRSAPSLISYR